MLPTTLHDRGDGADALTFPLASPGPRPLLYSGRVHGHFYTGTFYILSVEMAISLKLFVIPVFHYGQFSITAT